MERRDADLAPDPSNAPLFSARLRPHRSLTRSRRRAAATVFALAQNALGLVFLLCGAWPVAFFLALCSLGLVVAFSRNAVAARAYEDIELSFLELHYARVSPAGARRDWRFHPLWVRLEVARHEEFGVERLDLHSRQRRLEIGAFLGRGEKTELARDLNAALTRARSGPRFS
jgi:uncharacterized membrane protein